VRRIWPTQDAPELDPLRAVAAEARPARGRPWLLLNMVTALDGRITDREGRADGVSGPADRDLFHAMRTLADVVLVGAGTVRAEHYGRPRDPGDEAAEMRRARGQQPLPRLAVVTRSLRLDPTSRLFQPDGSTPPPIVLTTEGALSYAAETVERLADRADIRVAGEQSVDWKRALQILHDDLDARVVVAEGGPTVNSQLFADDLVDELCLALAPRLMGDDGPSLLDPGTAFGPVTMTLSRIFEHDAYLFLRYTKQGHG
jgi:riboflavin-specific deaminase-like protein